MNERLDMLVVQRGWAASREKAQALIRAGSVWQGSVCLDKPGTKYPSDLTLELRADSVPYVSRAGEKLAAALSGFDVVSRERVCLDIGASTGGFTDCLLQSGARHVFSVDVGYGQLDSKLRGDSRVTVLERFNARYLKRVDLGSSLASEIDLVVADVSFISLRKILPALAAWEPVPREWVLLFKPQFELDRCYIKKGGIVSDTEAVKAALEDFRVFMASLKMTERQAPLASPVAGKKKGNVEYLLHYERNERNET